MECGEMPKETVWNCVDLNRPSAAVHVHVAWGRGSDVYLSLNGLDAPALCDEGGPYATVDRKRINELIRILRRARDQAYGRDE